MWGGSSYPAHVRVGGKPKVLDLTFYLETGSLVFYCCLYQAICPSNFQGFSSLGFPPVNKRDCRYMLLHWLYVGSGDLNSNLHDIPTVPSPGPNNQL